MYSKSMSGVMAWITSKLSVPLSSGMSGMPLCLGSLQLENFRGQNQR